MSVAVLPFFMMERPTFTRERMNGAYAVGPWVLANMVRRADTAAHARAARGAAGGRP